MEGILDIDGRTVAWLQDDTVWDLDGYAVAFTRGSAVYGCSGAHFGFFTNGFFRDGDGNAVACIRGAHGMPPVPVIQAPPAQPSELFPRVPAALEAPSTPPTPTPYWSDLEWDDFVD